MKRFSKLLLQSLLILINPIALKHRLFKHNYSHTLSEMLIPLYLTHQKIKIQFALVFSCSSSKVTLKQQILYMAERSNISMGFKLSTPSYQIIFNGSAINIIDLDNHEMIAKFKDLKFAYRGMLNPNKNTFVAKSNDGVLAIYSLDSMTLISKYKKRGIRSPQDGDFCFGPQGSFLNLEYNPKTLLSSVVVHDDVTLEEKCRYFETEHFVLDTVEYDNEKEMFYIIGFERLCSNNPQDSQNEYFEMLFDGSQIIQKNKITFKRYGYLCYLKHTLRWHPEYAHP
ncbi:hypothetical protein MKZ02_12360 [Pseudobacillus sp. FSL P4-0506]|uniref:hypothetical protein n=1 Tax=Pseudobacillus sp. FSL P4-0506 TaxID=2921576 RepID=UPI0030F8D2A3